MLTFSNEDLQQRLYKTLALVILRIGCVYTRALRYILAHRRGHATTTLYPSLDGNCSICNIHKTNIEFDGVVIRCNVIPYKCRV